MKEVSKIYLFMMCSAAAIILADVSGVEYGTKNFGLLLFSGWVVFAVLLLINSGLECEFDENDNYIPKEEVKTSRAQIRLLICRLVDSKGQITCSVIAVNAVTGAHYDIATFIVNDYEEYDEILYKAWFSVGLFGNFMGITNDDIEIIGFEYQDECKIREQVNLNLS